MSDPRRVRLRLARLESREVPSVEWALPAGGGAYLLAVRGPDLILERAGRELARTPAAGAEVHVAGTSARETLTVDFGTAAPAARPRVTVDGGGGADTLRVAGLANGDGVEAGPGWARVTGAGTEPLAATGFPRIEVTAGPGPGPARVEGSAGNDVAALDGGRVFVGAADPAWQVRLTGFTSVEVGGGAGYDRIRLGDSRESDAFAFGPAGGELQRGDGIAQEFAGFERITLVGNRGRAADQDVFRLTAGPQGASYRAIGGSGRFLDAENRFDVRLRDPDDVRLTAAPAGVNVLSGRAVGYALDAPGFEPISAFRAAGRLGRPAALARIKEVALRLDPGLAGVTGLDLMLRLRNFVHHRVRRGENTTAWPKWDEYERFLQAIVSRQEAVRCQGASWLYRDLLNAFGVEAREVSLFSRTFRPNHASVEVRLDGRWVVMDPTFNVAFTDAGGRLLSFREMRQLGEWTIRDDGLVARHGWVINTKVQYERYLYRIVYPPLRP